MRPITQADIISVLALNNAHAAETSPLDEGRLETMLRTAFLASVIWRERGLRDCLCPRR